MKKILVFILALSVGVILAAGCNSVASNATAAKDVDNATALSYAQTGANMSGSINSSMGVWASSGSVSGGVSVSGVSLKNKTITGPNSNGYFHVVESTTESLSYGSATMVTTFETALYVKLVLSQGKVPDVYVYGTFTETLSTNTTQGNSKITYTQSYGSSSSPYHGQATWQGDTLTALAADGTINQSISSGAHTITMAMTFTGYSLPITSGDDYPTGTISITTTYDGTAQPTMTVTFNGTATASFSYGDYSANFSLLAT